MTGSGGAWESVDAVAATPSSVASTPAVKNGRPPLRLRRSRGPVLAGLDGGGAVFQRRLRDVLVGSALILVPSIALNLWVTIVAFDRFDPDGDMLPGLVRGGSGVEDVAVFSALLFASLVTAVVGHFCAQLLIGDRFGTHVTMARGLLNTLKRLPVITVAWLLTHWWWVLGVMIVVSADADSVGVLVFFGAIVSWFASAATLMVIPAMVGEDIGPFAAAKRNFRLVKLRYGICLLFVLTATILSCLLLTGIATLVPILSELGFVTFGDADGIVQGVMVQMAVLVVVPLIALGTAQVYIELRLVGEGLDLTIETDAAFGPPLARRGGAS